MSSADDDTKYEFIANPKAKNKVWEHFSLKRHLVSGEVDKHLAVCKKCKTEVKYSGGTTNLTTHLDRHHKHALASNVRQSSTSSCNQSEPQKKQLTLHDCAREKYSRNNPRALSITHAIGKFKVKDLRPYSIVSNDGFKDLLQVLDPRYDVPSRVYFSASLIPKFYDQTKVYVLNSLSEAPAVALTTDGWTNRATESYLTITATFIAADWSLKNFVLQTRSLPESHTGENIAKVIVEAVEEWKIPSTGGVPLVTENASNMTVAAREAGCKPHIGCYAHTLNLAAQKALKIPQVARLLGKVRKVVSFFHRSTTAAAQLKAKTKLLCLREVKLVQDVCTRWNSAVDMLERYLELQPAVFAALLSKDIKHKESDIVTLDDKDVETGEHIMKCLLPLRTITQALCSETMPTISIIMPIHTKLLINILAHAETDSSLISQMKTTMSKDLSSRYVSMKDFLDEASALDPRFKVSYLPADQQFAVYNRLSLLATSLKEHVKVEPGASAIPQTDQVQPQPETLLPNLPEIEPEVSKETDVQPKSGLASILDDIVFVREEQSTKTVLERAIDEVDGYKKMELLPFGENPLQWWKIHEVTLPLLAKLAKERLCIPATSVPSERVFSTAGDIVTSQRAAIDSDNVDKLIFLKKNMQ